MTAGRPPSLTISTSRPSARKQLGDSLRAGLHVCLVEGRERDAGDPGERFEVLAQCGQELGDPGLQGAQSGGVKVWGENVVGHDRERTHPARVAWPGARRYRGKPATRHTVSFVFGRKKTPEDSTPSAVTYADRPGAKNRPTPSRREQEAARKRPLVPKDRKAAAGQSREATRVARAKQRAAMLSGDESALPARDKGPVKRYIRDTVDARWNIGEFMLPVMFVVLALTFLPAILKSTASWATLLVFVLVYGLVVAGALDAFLMWRRTKGEDHRQVRRGSPARIRHVCRDARLPDASLAAASSPGRARGQTEVGLPRLRLDRLRLDRLSRAGRRTRSAVG